MLHIMYFVKMSDLFGFASINVVILVIIRLLVTLLTQEQDTLAPGRSNCSEWLCKVERLYWPCPPELGFHTTTQTGIHNLHLKTLILELVVCRLFEQSIIFLTGWNWLKIKTFLDLLKRKTYRHSLNLDYEWQIFEYFRFHLTPVCHVLWNLDSTVNRVTVLIYIFDKTCYFRFHLAPRLYETLEYAAGFSSKQSGHTNIHIWWNLFFFRFHLTPLSYETLEYAAGFSSEQCPEGIVAISTNTLRFVFYRVILIFTLRFVYTNIT